MILNINQLRAFHMAAKLGSVTGAARELMVTPPAITMQVKQLEESLSLRLMFREGNAIKLTEVGKKVFERAHVIFSEIREMENFLDDVATAKSGELRIGSPQAPAKYILPKLIALFNESYPEIKIVLDSGSTSRMIANLLNHESELAFVRYMPDEKRIKVKLIGQEKVLLTAAPDSIHITSDEISVMQLAEVPLIVPKAGSGMRDVIFEYLNKFGIKPNIVLESASTDLIKSIIGQDVGVAFQERYAVREELEAGRLKSVNILEGPPVIQFGIGYLRKKQLSPAAWAFLRLLNKLDRIVP